MKKKTRKKVVRRKRRSRKSMSEKRVMRIKRGLMKGAKKLRLGAKRTGAYVYGTLRRIVGNPDHRTRIALQTVRRPMEGYFLGGPDLEESVRFLLRKGYTMAQLKKINPDVEDELSGRKSILPNSRRAFPTPRFVGKGEYVWKKLTPSQKLRFIMESPRGRQSTPRSQELFASRSWNFLPRSLKIDLEARFANVESDDLMRNPMRSSFDKPTFGPMNTETRRVNTTTMAGMREAEKLRRAGWYQGPVTLFSATYYRQRALPKSSIARQIRGNPARTNKAHFAYAKIGMELLGTGLKIKKGERVYMTPATNIPGGGFFVEPAYPTGLWKQVSDGSILIKSKDFDDEITYVEPRGEYKPTPQVKPDYKYGIYTGRGIARNPPMYAHHMTSHRTHGLSIKQMMKLYRLVSSGNQKAVMYARRTLGIPMSESLSQVKAVVYHHILDLKGKI